MTGKGDRWGRDRLGRSEPAFLSANTLALPPPTCTARREAGRRWSAAVVFAARPANRWLLCFVRPVLGGESAGCVRLQCLFCGLCACCHSLPAMPTALLNILPPLSLLCPVHFKFCFACPRSCPCAPGSNTTCLQAARLSCWQLQHGPAVEARAPVHLLTLLLTFFPAESMILGHGCSVNL